MAAKSRHKGIKASSNPMKGRPAQSQPVDAEELTRRLFTVLAEQKASSERKRRARAEADRLAKRAAAAKQKKTKEPTPPASKHGDKPGSSPRQKSDTKPARPVESPPKDSLKRSGSKKSLSSGAKNSEEERSHAPSYHHVPQVAATQFALTTTAEPPAEKGPVHKLSRIAMKFHLDGPNASREIRTTDPKAPPYQQAKALRRAQSMREQQYERNHIHKPLPTTLEGDGGSDDLAGHQAFQSQLRLGLDRDEVKDARRRSTGSILRRCETPPVEVFDLGNALFSSPRPAMIGAPAEHRVDWTQSDEAVAVKAVNIPQHSHQELRKTESKWTLRGRLGSFGRHSKDEKLPSPTEEKLPQDLSPKSPISGFFSRFKR
ncbi:nucleic acid binding protein NABP domain-containing protein [Pochonia chlamydosporia 170]|uniref:Nucleic acid binding protein NABP domain-containing protein n=1 Tax=Pochonia chlamydosporia 170 TaxID=1380566 RepID=A0A179G9W3_METCM|nr:nucleic acid binding protein NABP domain-containing protein [Pochonia chlamydosporia 170]OAQ74308.1 nucleic acid binding protein NABP domain-containing protein [Pochonia chlamydosporia 170]